MGCAVRGVGSWRWSVGYVVRCVWTLVVEFGVCSARCGILGMECEVCSTRCGILGMECRVCSTRCGILVIECGGVQYGRGVKVMVS